jgi:hypothetical protein
MEQHIFKLKEEIEEKRKKLETKVLTTEDEDLQRIFKEMIINIEPVE